MDDTKGKELIVTHAQKDMTTIVLNDSKEAIGNDRELNVEAQSDRSRQRRQALDGRGEHRQEVDGDWSLTVGGGRD